MHCRAQHLYVFDIFQGVRNKEISTHRGAELLGVTYSQIYSRCFQTGSAKKDAGSPKKKKEKPSYPPTPGGPLTEERIEGLGIHKYDDYVSKGLSNADFWTEDFVDIVLHVSKSYLSTPQMKLQYLQLFSDIAHLTFCCRA